MFRFTTPVTRALTVATFLGASTLAGHALAASGAEAAAPVATSAVTHGETKVAVPGRVDKRIAELHYKFHISAAQEPQWTAVAQVMRDNAASMKALIKERAANAKTMNAMDDLISYKKLAEAHENGVNKLIPVFQTLYDSMSGPQKKSADDAFRADRSPHHHHGKQ